MKIYTFNRGREPASRAGFTLVELLVVITIIGILMALVLPALSGIFGNVNQMTCGTRLGSLATAINTSKQGGRYPTIGFRNISKRKKIHEIAPGSEEDALFSWRVGILEQMQLNALNDQIKNSSNRFSLSPFNSKVIAPQEGDDDTNIMLATKPVKDFVCPAFSTDALRTENTVLEGSEYDDYWNDDEEQGVGISNYVVLSAATIEGIYKKSESGKSSGSAGWDGIIIDRKEGVKNFKDGPDRTLMLTESRESRYASWIDATTSWVVAYHPSADEKPSKESGKWTGSASALNVGPIEGMENSQPYFSTKDGWQGKHDREWGPSSEHPGGVVMHVTASGAAKPIVGDGQNAITAELYMRLVTRGGGEDATIPGD